MNADALRAAFDAPAPFTVGLEEEVLLLEPFSDDPAPVATEVVERAAHPGVKVELPAAQVELLTRPHDDVDAALAELAQARRVLAAACDGLARAAAGAVHPTAPGEVALNEGERYRAIADAHGVVARRQLVGALQVHVALGDADRTLAVYNALRGFLPELTALAAAGPFHEGRDTGLATIRPILCTQLPRQGVPPGFASWDALAEELRWGAAAGVVPEPRNWWWELRPHVVHGTLELRVPDTQPTIASAAGVAGFAVALVRWLAARHDAGEALGAPASWRIAENRWLALRHGVEGELADLETGERRPTRTRLGQLIDRIEADTGVPLEATRALAGTNTAMALRQVGIDRAMSWLADRFLG